MRQVKVLQGIPGSGKSHYARKLCEECERMVGCGAEIVSADDYFMVPANGERNGEPVYKFDFSKLTDAHTYCFRRFIAAMQDRVDLIIVDNTNMTLWEASPYVLGAQAFGYDVEFVRVRCDLRRAHATQVHDVPMVTIERMVSRMEDPLPWWKTATYHNDH